MRWIAVSVMLALAWGVALADDNAEGARLFQEGRELAKAGRYDEACDRFGKSLELDRAAGTALNYGDCLEKLGQLGKAKAMFEEAAKVFEAANDSRAAFARDRANAVDAKLAIVVIKVAEPELAGLELRIAGETVAPARELELRREPGDIEIAASAPGREPFAQVARASAGQRVSVDIPALRVVAASPPVRRDEPPRRDRTRIKLAYATAGAGAAVLAAGGVLGVIASSQYRSAVADECTEMAGELVCSGAGAARVESSVTKANLALGLAIGGGVLVAAGVVLYVTAPKERVLTPAVGSGSVGLLYSGRF